MAEPPQSAASSLLESAGRTRIAPDPVVVPDRPPPVPLDDRPLPSRPSKCEGPDRLVGVPGSVHFALDRAILAPATRSVLDRAVEAIAPYSSVRIQLSGHTDLRASERYNQSLSERRVRAVRDYLVAHGVAVERLETIALGESRLLVDGQSVGDHARNRRVEIRYLLCDGSEVPVTDQRNDLQLESTRRTQVQREKD